jgi:pyruvate formate lyase activating enzyme
MKVGGIVDLSTKDIPEKVCLVIFITGCNLKCGYCHNKHLLLFNAGKEIDTNKLIEQIRSNNLVNSISITGGEPSLSPKIVNFCKKVSEMNKYISIDTNGTNPEIIKNIHPYIDRIALDLKAPLNQKKYEKIVNIPVNLKKILKSFKFVNKKSSIDFEVRTTYVKGLLKPKDIHKILKFLKKEIFRGRYVLQQYQYSEGVGPEYKDKFQKTQHSDLYEILKPFGNRNLPFEIYIRDDVVGYMSLKKVIEMANEEL